MQPTLRRFETTILKDNNPPSDKSQVPTAATIDFFRQGATVSSGGTVPGGSSASVSVYDVGLLVSGDNVKVNGEGVDLGVTVSSPTSILLENFNIGNVTVPTGARLVPQSNRPATYKDGLGTAATSVASQLSADASTGRAGGYLTALRFDFLVTISSRPSRLFIDAHGGLISTPLFG